MSWPQSFNISSKCKQVILEKESLSMLSSLGILQMGYCDAVESFTVYRKAPNFHMVLFTTSGVGQLETPEGNHRLEPGSVIVVPKGQANGFSMAGDHWSNVWYMLDPNVELSNQINTVEVMISQYGGLLRYNIESISLSLRFETASDKALEQLLLDQLQHIVKRSLSHVEPLNSTQMRLKHLTFLLGHQLHKPWSIDQMAKLIHCSPPHLYRLTQKWLNKTPMHVLQDLRVERAKQLLEFGDNSIQQVAELVGFSDLATFSKRFKAKIGLAPSKYRVTTRQNNQDFDSFDEVKN